MQDWADSISRGGKLATVNGIYLHALREMTYVAANCGMDEMAAKYADRYEHVRTSYLTTFWDDALGYIKAAADDNRIDAMANIYACLYHLGPAQCVRVQENLQKLVAPNLLLKNFNTPYPASMVALRYKVAGIPGYHNSYTWPWVTCENILAKLKIARNHPELQTRIRFFHEAQGDFVIVTENHTTNGDFYEVVDAETGKPVSSRFFGLKLYVSALGFMSSITTYIAAEEELEQVRQIIIQMQSASSVSPS